MKMNRQKFMRMYETHGVVFTGETGDGGEAYGTCPFTGKENKFYVNQKTGLWSSKTGGIGGTPSKFLELRSKDYQKQLTKRLLRKLARDRQLPKAAFKNWELGINDRGMYTIPVRDLDGSVTDIRMYSLRRKSMRSTTGAVSGLFGAPQIKERLNEPIYLCEGEWDTIALSWLLRILHEPGVVVGVPGAMVFKRPWIPWFQGRLVHTLYDADQAGYQGEEYAAKRLLGVAKKITYVHWPDEVPTGFDVRDWIVYGTITRNTPDACFEKLQKRFYDKPKSDAKALPVQRVITKSGRFTIVRKIKAPSKWKTPPTIEEVHQMSSKWLELPNQNALDVMLATCLTATMAGPPLWLFLVGPPGSTKSALLTSLTTLEMTEFVSSLTPHSLISGGSFNGQDPSLIPKLNNRLLVVKDFTAILSLSEGDQRNIFGTLRDAYDGYCSKAFGNLGIRSYESRFSVIAACTPQIYSITDQQQALGERFLKYSVAPNLHHLRERESIIRAIENSDRESRMHEEMRDTMKNFIERTCADREPASLTPKMTEKIAALARFAARQRGVVPRDRFQRDVEVARPSAEVGTRLGQQMAKMARGLATLYGKKFASGREYALVKKITLDTIAQRSEDVLRAMIIAMGGLDKLTPMSMRELAVKTGYSFATIQRIMSDLHALEIISRQGAGFRSTWTISDYIIDLIRKTGLYTHDELTRPPSTGKIRIKRSPHEPKAHPRYVRIRPGQPPVTVTASGSKITITTPPPTVVKPNGAIK
jgi:hypothetical protein